MYLRDIALKMVVSRPSGAGGGAETCARARIPALRKTNSVAVKLNFRFIRVPRPVSFDLSGMQSLLYLGRGGMRPDQRGSHQEPDPVLIDPHLEMRSLGKANLARSDSSGGGVRRRSCARGRAFPLLANYGRLKDIVP